MSIINKILSKKIKYPLSFRGLFPFCHSRESGNPSPLSMRGAKQRSNLSGFSLIELMVAVVILAIVVFGIILAFSTGFQGMADARDRTVATNYLQEKIEDFKNMNFNKVKDEPVTLIPGTKFHRGSIVLDLEKQDEVVTLKKIITQVRWMDREGNIKTQEASTLLYNQPDTSAVGDTAVEILLYAESYYTVLPETTVKLIAEIRDENGNIFTDYNGPITFSIVTDPPNVPTPLGSITTPQPVSAINGVANCDFLAIEGENVEGIERIEASATVDGNDLLDTVNIRVTTGPVGIVIEPASEDDKTRPASVDSVSTINLKVVKADYIELVEYNNPITLSAVGPGTLSTTTIPSVPTVGTTFALTSNGTPGVVEITASAPDLDMGYTEVIFTGEPESILVSSVKNSIYPDEETTITVTIVDENIYPVVFGAIGDSKTITLSASPDYGIFDENSNPINLIFEGQSSKTCVFKASPTGEFPQEITITANDSIGELNAGSTKIDILSPLVAHHIDVTFDPSIIELDDDPIIPSEITAIMKSEEGDIVYGNFITFEITNEIGTFSTGESITNTTLTGGMATITLYPDGVTSTTVAHIDIYSNDLESNPEGPPGNPDNPIEIEVLFHKKSAPDHINLTADPAYIFIGGDTCVITASIVDEFEVPVNCTGTITFSIVEGGDFGELIGSTTVELDNASQATIILFSKDTVGDVEIRAEANITSPSTVTLLSIITVSVKEVTLILVDGTVNYWSGFIIITFNIEIDGPSLNLESMKITWNKDISFLNEIGIKTPSSDLSYDNIINTGDALSPYTKYNINQILLPGESTIRLTFSKNMKNVPVEVIFYTDFGEFPISF